MKRKKILLVVHRYAPFPGGSEIYVRNIAEELRERGHDVTVLAQTHDPEVLKAGNYNGVKVTNDHNVLIRERWDLIVVHGGDVSSQNVVHLHADKIHSPVLYLIVKPSESDVCVRGLKLHPYLGVSTFEDWEHCQKFGVLNKTRPVRHGIRLSESIGMKGGGDYRTSWHITNPEDIWKPISYKATPIKIVSVGGFWPHKGMQELATTFSEIFPPEKRPHVSLHLYGYDCPHLAPIETDNIKVHYGLPHDKIINAIASADLYVMNSTEEGFGLVLLEAMVNRVPWAARNIAGARLMREHGIVYDDGAALKEVLSSVLEKKWNEQDIEAAYDYVVANHLIRNTVDDIMAILKEANK
jgi:glycosyltransferase involved in cell wall biosynthesis